MCTGCCSARRRSWRRWCPPCLTAGSLSKWVLQAAHTAALLLPCASPILLCFTLTQKVQSPIFGNGHVGGWEWAGGWKAGTTNPYLCHVRIHDPGILSVLWLVIAACQYRLRAGPPVRVSADCVKGGEGRGVCFAKQQRRGVSHKSLSTGWSLHGPHIVHTQPAGHCLSLVDTDFLIYIYFPLFCDSFQLSLLRDVFVLILFLLLAHQWGSEDMMALFVSVYGFISWQSCLNLNAFALCSAFVFGFDEAARLFMGDNAVMKWCLFKNKKIIISK